MSHSWEILYPTIPMWTSVKWGIIGLAMIVILYSVTLTWTHETILLDHLVYITVLLQLMLSIMIVTNQLERQSMWDYIMAVEEVHILVCTTQHLRDGYCLYIHIFIFMSYYLCVLLPEFCLF